MTSPLDQPPIARSSFVTVLAWIFIVIAGFTTFILTLQNVMFLVMFPAGQMLAPSAPDAGQTPPVAGLTVDVMRLFFLTFLVVSATTLVSAIGLSRRLNWARLLFIAILALGIVWIVAGLALDRIMFSSTFVVPADAPAQIQGQFEHMQTIMTTASVVMTLAMSVLFAWIIKRLLSKPVRAEFMGNR